MARYDDWSKERLAWKCRELEREIEQLVIDNELEPRLQMERRSYDAWVTNPER